MKRPYLFIILAAAAALLAVARPAEPLQRRSVKQMEFSDFLDRMKDSAGFEVTIEGSPHIYTLKQSRISGRMISGRRGAFSTTLTKNSPCDTVIWP
jgi:hypothetical protein